MNAPTFVEKGQKNTGHGCVSLTAAMCEGKRGFLVCVCNCCRGGIVGVELCTCVYLCYVKKLKVPWLEFVFNLA